MKESLINMFDTKWIEALSALAMAFYAWRTFKIENELAKKDNPDEILASTKYGGLPYTTNLNSIFQMDSAEFPYKRIIEINFTNCRNKKKFILKGEVYFNNKTSIRVITQKLENQL